MDVSPVTAWFFNWMWGLPLIVVTSVIHVVGLGLINDRVVQPLSGIAQRRRIRGQLHRDHGRRCMAVTVLHAIEGFAWAFAYQALGDGARMSAAVRYSFSAMTAYGHARILLEAWERWRH